MPTPDRSQTTKGDNMNAKHAAKKNTPPAAAPPTTPSSPAESEPEREPALSIVTRTIDEALVVAQRLARAVEQDSKNKAFDYRYASAEAIISETRGPLNTAGLSISPAPSTVPGERAWDLVPLPVPLEMETVNSSGKRAMHRVVAFLYRNLLLAHVNGERRVLSVVWPVIPESGRPWDKAIASALTASLAYVLRDLLLLPRVEKGTGLDDSSRDHGDGSSRDDRGDGGVPLDDPDQRPGTKADPLWRTDAQTQAIRGLFKQLGVTDPAETLRQAQEAAGDGVDIRTFAAARGVIEKLTARVQAMEVGAAESKPVPTSDSGTTTATSPSENSTPSGTPSPSTATTTSDARKKKSATALLLELKAFVDGANDSDTIIAVGTQWATMLQELPAGARVIADAYIAAKANALAGLEDTPAVRDGVTKMNDLAKE
jgi:hypothetical protein